MKYLIFGLVAWVLNSIHWYTFFQIGSFWWTVFVILSFFSAIVIGYYIGFAAAKMNW